MEKDLLLWKVTELKDHLRKLGLKVSGKNKAELIQRIRDYAASTSKYLKMTIKQLKSLLKERKLKQTGRKIDLVKRLEDSEIKKTRESPSPNRSPVPKRTSSPKRASPKRATRREPSPKRKVSPTRPIAELPVELLHELLHNLDDKELANTCKTDKRAANVCKDDKFWNERIKRKFDYNLSKYKDDKVTYKDMYDLLRTNKEKYTQLLNAARLGYLPLVKYLVENVNIENISADTMKHTLYNAAEEGQLEVVKYLIMEPKYNIYIDKYDLQAALDSAGSFGHLNVVKYLIKNGADIDDNLFLNIAYAGEVDVFEYLAKHKKPNKTEINEALTNAINITPIGTENLLMVKYLVDKQGATDLHFALIDAIERGQFETIKYLVEKGVDIHEDNDAALDTAEEFGREDIIRYIENLP